MDERSRVDSSDSARIPVAGTRATLMALVAPVYLPIVAGTLGLAMLVPVLPLYLTEVGASLRLTSIVLAALGTGATLGGLPAGALIARFGERRAMFVAIVALAITSALIGLTETSIALIALRAGTGAANVTLRLSRQTYITRRIGPEVRGRAMSAIGFSFRVSLFVGPLLGGVLAEQFGFSTTFVVAGALSALGIIPPLLQPPSARAPARSSLANLGSDDAVLSAAAPGPPSADRPVGLFATIRAHRRLLAMVAIVPMMLMAVREGRYVLVPLIGEDLGLGPTAIGALLSVGTAADMLLAPVSGFVMDRFGRLWAMVPSFGLIGVGLVILGAADSTAVAVVAGVVMGIGNGLGSGSLLTLGSDLAPADAPGPFLAAIAVIQDIGRIIGPLLVGFVGALTSLGGAAIVLAFVMAVVIVWLVTVIGETGTPKRPSRPPA